MARLLPLPYFIILLFLCCVGIMPHFVFADQKPGTTGTSIKYCVQAAQAQSLPFWNSSNPRFAFCTSLDSEVVLTAKNRLSTEEITEVSSSLETVSDCLGLPYQTFFAKFYAESGLQSDIMGNKGDAGLGQLTGVAIRDVQKNASLFWNLIHQSTKLSCQSLSQKIQNFGVQKFFQFPAEQRCQVIFGPTGILRNVLFAFALNQLNKNYVAKAFQDFKIEHKLKAAGYNNPPLNRLIQMLSLLSYNNGGYSSVRDLNSFLESRIDFIQRKSQEVIPENFTPQQRSKFLAEVGPSDFNFRLGAQKFNSWLRKIQKNSLITATETTEGPRNVSESQALRNISASQLGFPEWLRIWQSNGGPGYMNGIYLKSEVLKNKGLGTCVDDRIFHLSNDL